MLNSIGTATNGSFLPFIYAQKALFWISAIFLAFIAIVPTIVFKAIGGSGMLVNAFSATGMIIVVGVALEVNKQLETLLMMKNYRGFLK